MDADRRRSLRAATVRDILSRIALSATSTFLDERLSRIPDEDWKSRASMVAKFIKALPSIAFPSPESP